jgi:hypothetical protein
MTSTSNQYTGWIAAFTFLSWLGGYIHHRVELPQLTLWSPEHIVPIVTSIALFLAWSWLPYKRLTTLALLGWALFPQFLLSGVLSVLPFDFWPFVPPQTVGHYLIHLLYALAQMPLILALIRQLRLIRQNNGIFGVNT